MSDARQWMLNNPWSIYQDEYGRNWHYCKDRNCFRVDVANKNIAPFALYEDKDEIPLGLNFPPKQQDIEGPSEMSDEILLEEGLRTLRTLYGNGTIKISRYQAQAVVEGFEKLQARIEELEKENKYLTGRLAHQVEDSNRWAQAHLLQGHEKAVLEAQLQTAVEGLKKYANGDNWIGNSTDGIKWQGGEPHPVFIAKQTLAQLPQASERAKLERAVVKSSKALKDWMGNEWLSHAGIKGHDFCRDVEALEKLEVDG